MRENDVDANTIQGNQERNRNRELANARGATGTGLKEDAMALVEDFLSCSRKGKHTEHSTHLKSAMLSPTVMICFRSVSTQKPATYEESRKGITSARQ